jgi:D-tyrosyl-tRNA(Tyr) deacylase
MISIVQRVTSASVDVNCDTVGVIGTGLMVLVCIEKDDTIANVTKMIDKLLKYRIFEDANAKMNLSVQDIKGSVLLVPQFTLAASTSKGLRPSFSDLCPPAEAKLMFDDFVIIFKQKFDSVQSGIFGADMKVSLVNDGPVTFTFKV